MPSQDRVGREQGADLGELFASQDLAFDGQAATLVIGQQNSPFTERLYQDSTLVFEIVDPLLLLLVAPIGNDQQEQLPWLQDEVHWRLEIRANLRRPLVFTDA